MSFEENHTKIKRVAVGTTNPAKIEAVRNVVQRLYGSEVEVLSVDVRTGISAQPRNGDTIKGAIGRAKLAYKSTGCDMAVGIEAGVFEASCWLSHEYNNYPYTTYMNVQYCAVYDGVWITIGSGSGFMTPYVAIPRILAGEEFGKIMDRITGVADIGRKEGGIGYMTNGTLTRTSLTEQAVFMALVPRMKPELYNRNENRRNRK